MVTEEIATLKENQAFQMKAAELKKYWRTKGKLECEIKGILSRRKTVAVQIATTELTPELRTAFRALQSELRLLWDINECVEKLRCELLNDIYNTFGMEAATPPLNELFKKWEQAVQHGSFD